MIDKLFQSLSVRVNSSVVGYKRNRTQVSVRYVHVCLLVVDWMHPRIQCDVLITQIGCEFVHNRSAVVHVRVNHDVVNPAQCVGNRYRQASHLP